MTTHCPTCHTPWAEHLGIAGTCAELCRLKARKVRLPARRYLKDRTLGDDTFSTHAQGWDDALDAVEESLRAAGIPVEEGP